MPRLLQIIAVLMCLLASRPLRAFSLLGPVAPNPGAEAWQTPALGYNPPGAADIGAPKNLTEEYRWNVPVITYGFDNSFINYFGTNGMAAVDEAFAILNSLPDLSTLDQDLSEYALKDPTTGANTTFRDSRRVNMRAQADGIVDLKSVALGSILELSGLAAPERWVWAVRDRQIFNNNTITDYFTIMRNFDPVTYKESKYVNGNRYTYDIVEFPPPTYTDAIERAVDPEHIALGPSSVASVSGGRFQNGLDAGIFYTYLTRDDIGGLRYIYDTNNVNWEPFPPGTQMLAPDTSNPVSITNQDLTLFSIRSTNSPPSLLLSLYPGLIISATNFGPEITISNVPVVATQTVTISFITNTSAQVLVSNIDLGTFSSVTLTSAPANLVANLQAAFPGVPNLDQLVVLSTSTIPTTIVQPSGIILTNLPKQPWDDPFTTNFVFRTNFVTNATLNYFYTFRNTLTNNFSPLTTLRRITTGLEKEPWSEALNPVFKTTVEDIIVTSPSGGITIVPTNLLGYSFTGFAVTNILPVTNFFFITNIIDPNSGLTRTISRTEVRLFTNTVAAAFPIEILPSPIVTNIVVTNGFVTLTTPSFRFGYANVITNYFSPTTPARLDRFVIDEAGNRTRLSTTQTNLPVPSGGFIIDTNQTGLAFTGISNSVVVVVTNTIAEVIGDGLRIVDELVYNFTNTTYLVFPFVLTNAPASVQRPGIGKLRYQRIGGTFTGGGFLFTNRYSATYITNNALVTNVFQNVQTRPDILIEAQDLGTFANSVAPVQFARGPGTAYVNNAALNNADPGTPGQVGAQGGPGTIFGSVTIVFNKVGPGIINEFPGFTTESSALSFQLRPFVWGRFDGSTNPPIVFPNDITLDRDIEPLITGGIVP